MPKDPRKVVGAYIKAKAISVTNEAECSRRYGDRKKTFWVKGVVQDVIQSPGTIARIQATFDMGGGHQKTAVVCITSVRESSADEVLNVDLPPPPSSLPPPPEHNPADNTQTATPVEAAHTLTQVATPQGTAHQTIQPLANPPQGPLPAASTHGMNWFEDPLLFEINGFIPPQDWCLRTTTGDRLRAESNISQRLSPLDVFLLMFPPRMFDVIVTETNIKLLPRRKQPTTKGEILSIFGMLILISKYEFTERGLLWNTTSPSKYEPAPCLGKTGMSKNRFDDLFSALTFGHQPATRPLEMSSERYRWLLVCRFII